MSSALVIVTALAIAANGGIAAADLARAEFVLANSAEVNVKPEWVPWLAALKLAGVVGLLIGLVAFPPLGLAAALGLVLFYVGAVVTHVRAGVIHNIYFPAGYLALAVATLALTLAR
ncbi:MULTISPECIES: DoxX family protein [Kitasatospora]|uniref:DoxX family protein n=1 Tax=Kitasatospora cathayae TaxID=3004092 RepID=A0ABY7Q1R6_9ACTN|nr:DoxX family protein [Kitasatospora sp. HUAS 3-15]WBP86648.1 DoxX family protein [Kitasatospora sp. HUAS 3-15]